MTVTIRCSTLFDITVTGVRNHTSNSQMPFRDQSGQMIETDQQWVRSRNQQRNWETLNQILGLRTLPENIQVPRIQSTKWHFEFDIPDMSAVSTQEQPLGLLMQDCENVPMITGLSETVQLVPELRTQGTDANIWFEIVS